MLADYQRFLARAVSRLAAEGGQTLFDDAGYGRSAPAWTLGWDRLVLVDTPGSAALYAFTRGSGRQADELRSHLDQLAAGAPGSFSLPPTGLRVFAVVAGENLTASEARRITRLAPSTYVPGLRPTTLAVDLASGQVSGGRLGRSEARRLLTAAAGTGTGELLDPDGVRALQREHENRMAQFYAVMRARPPVLTYALIAVNVGIILLLYANGGPDNESTLRTFGALSPRLVEEGQWWRLFTSMFLHAGIAHILFNMTSLFAVGTLAERLYGSTRYLAIYLGAGLAGSLVSFGFQVAAGNLDTLGVGASGAIFGVAGALLTLRFQSSDIIPARLRSRISTSMLPLVLISLVFSFFTPNVDSGAHLGGLVAGMLLSFVLPVTNRVRQADLRP